MPFVTSALFMLLSAPPVPPQAPAKPESTVQEEVADTEEGLICRKKMVPHAQIMNRLRSVRVCKSKEDWARLKSRRN
jgi:hypothetical protein